MSWPQNFVQSYVTHKTGEDSPSGLCCIIFWIKKVHQTSQASPFPVLTDDVCSLCLCLWIVCVFPPPLRVIGRAVRQEEKRRLLRRNTELKKECAHLEEQDKMLNKSLEVRRSDVAETELMMQTPAPR